MKDISSVQPDVFLKKRQWKPLAKMPLWETSLSNLIRWLCYERTKQLFWRAVHRALARPEGKSRMALCFPFPIVELQNLICRVPSENLDAKLMVKLSKKLWCCRQIVQRHDGATPTRFRKLRLMLCAMHTKPLRRAFSKATESQNQYSGRHRLKRRSSSHAST